jgi:hypothetical protein
MPKPTLVATLVLAAGCAGVRVHSEVAPQADLGHYRTFGWLKTERSGPETIIDQRIRASLRGQLLKKGLTEVPSDAADFLISYHVLQEHKLAVSDWGNGIYGWAPEVVSYSDGALIVDFIDPRTNRIFWRGSASSAVEHPGVVDAKRLEKASAALVGHYPAAAGQVARAPLTATAK